MLSLANTDPLEDVQSTFTLICSGGEKAVGMFSKLSVIELNRQAIDWLDDKLVRSKFAFPALYWPASNIPLDIWKAVPATTNGNEQVHRNVNRDGVGLTLLAGVMRGMHYDRRAFHGLQTIAESGVHVRDVISTHHSRKMRAITRKGN